MADIQPLARPLKILYLHPTFTFGGAERTSQNLLNGLDKERFHITLLTSKTIANQLLTPAVREVIYVEDIGMDIWFDGLRRLWKDIRIVSRILADKRPDIAFGMMHYSSTLLALAKKLFVRDAKIVASPRGPSSVYLETCFTKISDRLFLKCLFNAFCRFSDGIIVPSFGTKEDCVKHYGADSNRAAVINNGMDIDVIRKTMTEAVDIRIPDNIPIIATAGRLSKEKNTVILLQAFALIRKKREARLLIIGDGSEMERLRVEAERLRILEDIIFTGFQQNPYKYIRLAHLFVHTCLVEGFGNIIVEAMACGVPVIATDCPYGPREIIQHNRNGILVPMNDTEALSEAIEGLLVNEKRRGGMADNAAIRAHDFNVNKMVKAYEEFFLNFPLKNRQSYKS
ncbi:MAG: glycosyltransferase [Nitrospirae bacterium]|nr:glycosyltransferase [Nitrospirota bacterium]